MPSFGRNVFGSMDPMMDFDRDANSNEGTFVFYLKLGVRNPPKRLCSCPVADGSVNEDVVITKPFGDGKITCREIRRNSAGCLRFRNECEKCKEIQHIGEMISYLGCK